MLYGLNDICIVPAEVSYIDHRGDCNPKYSDGYLPLFTAPMTSVVNEQNFHVYNSNGIHSIIPRSVPLNIRLDLIHTTFVAMGLDEFEKCFILSDNYLPDPSTKYVLVDIANGHMKRLLDLCKSARIKYGESIKLMAGNIANPKTIRDYAAHGIDYVRVGIGSGNACTTSANGGVHYPMASLIAETRESVASLVDGNDWYKATFGSVYRIPKIVADGGMKNFDHIIKALALGADYVMCGEIFARSMEAAGGTLINGGKLYTLSKYNPGWSWKDYMSDPEPVVPWKRFNLFREYYGMSTKRAQKEFGSSSMKTSEGISKYVPIEYSLEGWVDNFIHYLRTTMSYCGSSNLESFIGKVQTEVMSQSAFRSYYK